MNQKIRNHCASFSTNTNPGLYKQKPADNLPSAIREISLLVRQSVIYGVTLVAGNTGSNADLRFGDVKCIPWWRQLEDDILVTTAIMLAEMYRYESKWVHHDKSY